MPLEAIVEERLCAQCNTSFAIYQGDIPFYRRFDVPTPAICFSCRLQTRLAAHKRRNLYRRKCDATGADIVSWLSPDKPFRVYCGEYWRGDAWDARDYGREYDFSRLFFEQFYQLMLDAPVTIALR